MHLNTTLFSLSYSIQLLGLRTFYSEKRINFQWFFNKFELVELNDKENLKLCFPEKQDVFGEAPQALYPSNGSSLINFAFVKMNNFPAK